MLGALWRGLALASLAVVLCGPAALLYLATSR